MKIEKKKQAEFIQIGLKDLGDFSDVALLVDTLDFRKEIERTRLKYKSRYNFPFKSEREELDFTAKRILDKGFKVEFEADLERIRRLFNRPYHFLKVIEDSLVYGSVNDYSKAYLEEQEFPLDENPESTPDKKYCIVIHAGTREDDVLHVWREFKEKVRIELRGTEEEQSNYNHGYADLSLLQQKMRDTSSSIDKLHNWYISGKKPLELALAERHSTFEEYKEIKRKIKNSLGDENDREKMTSFINNILKLRDSIKEQLRQYRQLLKISIL